MLALRPTAAAVALIALSSLLPAASAHAQVPVLVKDLVTGTAPSDPHDLVAVGSTLFFSASDGHVGRELWKSDGTEAGTVLVKDIWSGTVGSAPADLTPVGPLLFFTANDGVHGRELWKSDGTAAGTVLVADVDSDSGDMNAPRFLTAVGSTLYFVQVELGRGPDVWRSDGTAVGKVMVRHFPSCDVPREGACANMLTDVGGTLFFAANEGTSGWELWTSDGTAASTTVVSDICPGMCNGITCAIPTLTHVDGTLYFQADDGISGAELWKSDGTSVGTTLVKDVKPGSAGSSPHPIMNAGGRLFFRADDGVLGSELWTSNGTEAGTVLVKDINPGPGELGALGVGERWRHVVLQRDRTYHWRRTVAE